MANKRIINGVSYNSDTSIAKKYQIKRQTFSARIAAGMTPEEAASHPVSKRGKSNQKKQDVLGKKYDSFEQACSAYNQNPSTIQSRMKNKKLSLEEALAYKKSIVVNEIEYLTKKDACDKLKLNYKTVISYEKRKGVTFEQACNHYM